MRSLRLRPRSARSGDERRCVTSTCRVRAAAAHRPAGGVHSSLGDTLRSACEHTVTRIDAAAYIAWLRREPHFRSCVSDIGESLRHGRDTGSPEQLLDPVTRVASVLPPSARGLWMLLLDERLDLVVGPGDSLEREEWERLVAIVRARMDGHGPTPAPDEDDDAGAEFLESALLRIDPAAPVLMPSAWIASPSSRAREAAA